MGQLRLAPAGTLDLRTPLSYSVPQQEPGWPAPRPAGQPALTLVPATSRPQPPPHPGQQLWRWQVRQPAQELQLAGRDGSHRTGRVLSPEERLQLARIVFLRLLAQQST